MSATHFAPDGKPIAVGSMVMRGSVVGLVRELRTKTCSDYPRAEDNGQQQAFVVGLRGTQGVWHAVAELVSGEWRNSGSCEDGGQI